MTDQAMTLIQPATVERYAAGCWWHPALPDFENGDRPAVWVAWLEAQRLECASVQMADEAPVEAFERYLEGGGWADWQPSTPEGDGWFLLCIAEDEQGPSAWWARRANHE